MTQIAPLFIGGDALRQLTAYCANQALVRFALIADANTYRALGEQVERALRGQGYEVTVILLPGDAVIADERSLMHTLIHAPVGDCTFLAVGSGTITDITRFISHRTGRAFISLPTAPSVDGFTSIGAPLVLNGVKQTFSAQAPRALFADLDTLRNAPQALIAAGFGDMLGKLTSLADWQLGALLWDEPFDDGVYTRVRTAVQRCIDHAEAIGQRSEEGIRLLMDALIESGLCMLEIGNSRPASGAEHHASHYWEMQLLREGRPAALHGAKVSVATVHVARQYAQVRALRRAEMLDRLEAAVLPTRAAEIESIETGYGDLAQTVIAEHAAFLDLTTDAFDALKHKIVQQWEAVQTIAASVPAPEQIINFLAAAGAPTDGAALGLTDEEIQRGMRYGHYLRNRFTVMKLSRILDI